MTNIKHEHFSDDDVNATGIYEEKQTLQQTLGGL